MIARIEEQPLETLFLSAITVAELRAGVALLPAGKHRSGLQEIPGTRVLPLFAGRVLPFSIWAAPKPSLAVATRDSGLFKAAGAAVINPWQA